MHMDVCADKDVHMDAHVGAFGHDEHGFALLQDVAHNINVDYADTILDVVACTTHRRSIKRAQMLFAGEAVDPGKRLTATPCKAHKGTAALNSNADSQSENTAKHACAAHQNALLAHRCQCPCFKRVCRDALQYVALVRVTST